MEKDKQKILDFIKKKKLGVISTINQEGKPESAVVAFSETDKLELIFGTFNTTRKYKNLKANQNISFVIGWDEEEKITIQYEGLARDVKDEEFEECRTVHLNKNPSSKKFAFGKEQRYFKITPRWIRYSDLSLKEIFEVVFD